MPNELKSESIGELATALAKAQAKIENARTDKTNPHFRSRYADLSAVWEACRVPLTENGLSVSQCPEWTGDKLVLRTLLMHTSGQWISGSYPISPERETPQGVGSALTYARRYSLASMVGVAPDDDDDGNAASSKRTENGEREASPPSNQGKPASINPDMPLAQLAQYVVPIGKKFKGTALGKIPLSDLVSFTEWLRAEEKKSGKPASTVTQEFLSIAEAFLNKSMHGQLHGGES